MLTDTFVVISIIAIISSPLLFKSINRKGWMLVNTALVGIYTVSWILILTGMNALWIDVVWYVSLVMLLVFFFISFTFYITSKWHLNRLLLSSVMAFAFIVSIIWLMLDEVTTERLLNMFLVATVPAYLISAAVVAVIYYDRKSTKRKRPLNP